MKSFESKGRYFKFKGRNFIAINECITTKILSGYKGEFGAAWIEKDGLRPETLRSNNLE